jgi:hypothetical protein
MFRTVVAVTFVLIVGGYHTPVEAAEFRKSPPRTQLRKTLDIGNENGNINTDPAITNSTTRTKPSNAPGTECRNGSGQTYPNANTDNPPGFQPCPQ